MEFFILLLMLKHDDDTFDIQCISSPQIEISCRDLTIARITRVVRIIFRYTTALYNVSFKSSLQKSVVNFFLSFSEFMK